MQLFVEIYNRCEINTRHIPLESLNDSASTTRRFHHCAERHGDTLPLPALRKHIGGPCLRARPDCARVRRAGGHSESVVRSARQSSWGKAYGSSLRSAERSCPTLCQTRCRTNGDSDRQCGAPGRPSGGSGAENAAIDFCPDGRPPSRPWRDGYAPDQQSDA